MNEYQNLPCCRKLNQFNYWSWYGRITRTTFFIKYVLLWVLTLLAVFGAYIAYIFLLSPLADSEFGSFVGLIVAVLTLGLIFFAVLMFALNLIGRVKRFHDFGVSGWLVVIFVVLGLGWISFWMALLIPGSPYPNKYGDLQERH